MPWRSTSARRQRPAPPICGRRLADDVAERPAERPQAGEPDVEADVGHAAVGLAQQEHRPLDPPALQIAVRRLAERGAKRPDEVRLRDVARSAPGSECRAARRRRDPSRPARAASAGWTPRRRGPTPTISPRVVCLPTHLRATTGCRWKISESSAAAPLCLELRVQVVQNGTGYAAHSLVVVGTGVDPVTFRFSGGRSAN